VDGDHAANLALVLGHEIAVLVMELVDQAASTRIGMLLDLDDEGPIHQAMDLIELFRVIGQHELVASELQAGPTARRRNGLAHGRCPSSVRRPDGACTLLPATTSALSSRSLCRPRLTSPISPSMIACCLPFKMPSPVMPNTRDSTLYVLIWPCLRACSSCSSALPAGLL